jgi:hypothetical protein
MVTLVRWYVLLYSFGLTIMPAALAAYILAAAAAGAGIAIGRRGEHLWPRSILGPREADYLRSLLPRDAGEHAEDDCCNTAAAAYCISGAHPGKSVVWKQRVSLESFWPQSRVSFLSST